MDPAPLVLIEHHDHYRGSQQGRETGDHRKVRSSGPAQGPKRHSQQRQDGPACERRRQCPVAMVLSLARCLPENKCHREVHSHHAKFGRDRQVWNVGRESVQSEPRSHQESGWSPWPRIEVDASRAEECHSACRNEGPADQHQPGGRVLARRSQPVCGSNGQIVQNKEIPADGPHPKIGPGLDPLQIGEEARGKRVDRQDSERKNANVHDGAVDHWAVSPHLRFRRISRLCRSVAASGTLSSRGSSRREIGKCFLPNLVLNIDYGLRASNGTGVLNTEHCLCAFLV